MVSSTETLIDSLASWMRNEHARFHRSAKISRDQKNAIQARAAEIVTIAAAKKTLRILREGNRPIAALSIHPSKNPRVRHQKVLFFSYDPLKRNKAVQWLQNQMPLVGQKTPRYTQFGLSPADDKILRSSIEAAGFNTRYELLVGETKIALKNLIAKKCPARDLNHLGLDLKVIASEEEVEALMKFQKRVARKNSKHGYFSHTKDQLKKDEIEYRKILRGEVRGLILGVYRRHKLLGLMGCGIHEEIPKSHCTGGFSFLLDNSIHGMGVVKTGYLYLLEYLKQQNVRKFYGGTSQPAVKSLGKIMRREIQSVLYVKM